MDLVSAKCGVERLILKPGESTTGVLQKAKVNGLFTRCLQSRKEKQSPLTRSLCMQEREIGKEGESKPKIIFLRVQGTKKYTKI